MADPLAVSLHLPLAVAHEPVGDRAFPPDAPAAPGMILNDAIQMVIEPRDSLRDVSSRLQRTALSRFIANYEAVVAAFGSRPAFWVRDLQLVIHSAERALADPNPIRPEQPGRPAVPDAAVQFQTYIRYYGSLLLAWPATREAAIQWKML